MTDVKKERFEKVIEKMVKRKWKYRMIEATLRRSCFWIFLGIVAILQTILSGIIDGMLNILLYVLIEVVLFGSFYWFEMQSTKMDMFKEAGL